MAARRVKLNFNARVCVQERAKHLVLPTDAVQLVICLLKISAAYSPSTMSLGLINLATSFQTTRLYFLPVIKYTCR